jgi:HD-like signal output (HDOD) protein
VLRGLWKRLSGRPAGAAGAGKIRRGSATVKPTSRAPRAAARPAAPKIPEASHTAQAGAAPAKLEPTVAEPANGAAAEAPRDPFVPFAEVLGIEAPREPAPLSEEDERADAELAALILERFRASRPEQASFPGTALQIVNLVASPRAEVSELSRIISRDPALTAGVLQVSNSLVFRGLMEVETVRDAVARLGLNEVGRVAAAISARTLFSPKVRAEQAHFGSRWNALFARAVAVGSAAAAVALRHPGARSDRVYLGGLLHDIGKSLALRTLARLILDGRVPDPDPERLERVLDRVNLEVGGEAHQAWDLPQYLTVICVRHHDEQIPSGSEFVDLHLVRLTSALDELREPAFAWRASREIVQTAGALRLDPYTVRMIFNEMKQAEQRSGAMLSDAQPAAK